MIPGQSQYPIAIDTDGRQIVALQLAGHPDRICIKSIFKERLNHTSEDPPPPEDGGGPDGGTDSDALAAALKRIRQTKGFSGRRAVVHIPEDNILSFPVEIHLNNGQDMDMAILSEMNKTLPYPLEEAVVDYFSIFGSGSGGKKTVIVTAARRQDVLDLIRPYETAGFHVDAVDFSPLSLNRLHGFLEEYRDTPDLICHIGRTHSSLQVVGRDRIYAMSKFDWGRQNLEDRLNRTLKLPSGEDCASDLLQRHGLEGAGAGVGNAKISGIVSRILTPAVEELVFEFHKILGYARDREQFQSLGKVFLYGLGSGVRGLYRYIEQRFNIRVVQGKVQASVVWKDPARAQGPGDELSGLSAVIGLAMRRVPWR